MNAETITKTKGGGKDYSISFIRMLSLIMIVTCHIMQYLGIELAWWFNVGVQIFLCISGYLYGQRDIHDIPKFISSRFKKILTPYYVVFLVFSILTFVFARSEFSTARFLKGLLVNATIKGGEHLWFIPTILMCYVITPALQIYRDKYAKNKKSIWFFSIAAFVFVSLYFGGFSSFFNPAWMSCYVIGYVLGANAQREYVPERVLGALIIPVAIVGNAIQVVCTYRLGIEFLGFTYFCDYNHVLLGIALFLIIRRLFSKYKLGRKMLKILDISDKYSYEAYLVHQFVILGSFSMMTLTGNLIINIFAIILVVVLMAYTLKTITKRIEVIISKFQ